MTVRASNMSAEEALLHQRFQFLRERVYAASRAFVERVLGGVEEGLAQPAEPFAGVFFAEIANLLSAVGSPSDVEPSSSAEVENPTRDAGEPPKPTE